VVDTLITGYKKEGLHSLILNWITTHNLPFQIAESDEFKAILLYGNSLVYPSHIPSADTLIRLLFSEYEKASSSVKSVLQTALHLIHFCFDGWTSRSNLSFLGINAQFVDKDFRVRKVLLGLPQLAGRHTGEALSEEVSRVLSFWGLDDKLGFFTLDNATNNDRAMQAIGDRFGFDGTERRLRCAPHCINRVVRAMLYGNETKSLAKVLDDTPEIYDADGGEEATDAAIQEVLDEDQESAFGVDEPEDDCADAGIVVSDSLELPEFTYPISKVIDQGSLARFKRKGPIGKLHNVGVSIKRSPRLRKMYLQAQVGQPASLSNKVANQAFQVKVNRINKKLHPERTYEWVQNVETRWSSDRDMISHALDHREAVNQFIVDVESDWEENGAKPNERPGIIDDKLSVQDWKLISVYDLILEPFAIVTSQLQGVGSPGTRSTSGGFWEYFPNFEMLLDHLEDAEEGTVTRRDENKQYYTVDIFKDLDAKTRRWLKIHVKLAWKRLDKYYNLFDQLPYVAAVLLHPCKKWKALEELWEGYPTRRQGEWKKHYNTLLRDFYDTHYKDVDFGNQPVQDTDKEADECRDYVKGRIDFKRARRQADAPRTSITGVRRGRKGRLGQGNLSAAAQAVNDELSVYLAEAPVESAVVEKDPVEWWRQSLPRFPTLGIMAIDFLSIPSSSAESERSFSSAGRMATPVRNRLRHIIITMAQCLRSWWREGFYKPTIPLDMFRDVLQQAGDGIERAGIASWNSTQ